MCEIPDRYEQDTWAPLPLYHEAQSTSLLHSVVYRLLSVLTSPGSFLEMQNLKATARTY